MKKARYSVLSIFFVFILIPINIVYGQHDTNFLDVRISKNIDSLEHIKLLSDDGFYLYDKLDKERHISEIIEKKVTITRNSYDGLDILDLEGNVIESISGDGSIIIGTGSVNSSIIQVEDNSYRDFISFYIKSGELTMINHINIENYLYGVVPKEIGASFPIESIKAQAVAARTFAMANKTKHINDGFDLCDTTHCQVYGGVNVETPTTNEAVDDTKGMYVYYDGKFADTTFHSNNGGYIESSKDVWGGHLDYLVAKEDPFSANTTASTWDLQLTNDELNNKISTGGINIGNILDIEILERTEANRVTKVKLKGVSGEEVISGSRLRALLGNTSMKSTWFDVIKEGEDPNTINDKIYAFDMDTLESVPVDLKKVTIIDGNNKKVRLKNQVSRASGSIKNRELESVSTSQSKPKGFTFKGRGYGHGVGMSQFGAMEMAKQGYSYEEILKYYYTGVDIIYNGR